MKIKRRHMGILFIMTAFLLSLSASFSVISTLSRNSYAEEMDREISSITASHYVTVYDSGKSRTVKTDASTVGELLERLDYEIDASDIVDPGLATPIDSPDYSINIYRARPVIVTDGTTKKYLSSASFDGKTVVEAAGFPVYDGDEITVQENSTDFLETGVATTYTVSHNGGTTVTVEEEMPYTERTENNAELPAGTQKLLSMGEMGLKQSTYKITFKDGVEVGRELVFMEVVKEPVDRVVAVGMKVASTMPAEWNTCAAWAREAGVSESDLQTALTLIYKESNCRAGARNSSTGAYGIPQALPGSKMASAGADWETNPVTQIRWMINYVNGRYGGWSGAWAFWSTHHWY